MTPSPHQWMTGPGYPVGFEAESFSNEQQGAEFAKRRRVAAATLAGDESNDRAELPLSAFVALAVRHAWALPDAMRKAEPAAPAKLPSSAATVAPDTAPAPDPREAAHTLAVMAELVRNGREIDWRYWFEQMPNLSAAEAARLLAGLDPVVFANLDARPNGNDARRACERAANIERVGLAEGLPRRKAMEWLTWANAKGLPVHPGFVFAAQEAGSAGTESPRATETPQARRARRLARFKALGGDMRKAGTGWHSTGARGALATLVREERETGRPMSDKTDVRADLRAAMEDQRGS